MSRNEILNMPAGEKLNELVATRVFSWVYLRENEDDPESDGYWHNPIDPLGYSTPSRWSSDIAFAWEVCEEIQRKNGEIRGRFDGELTNWSPLYMCNSLDAARLICAAAIIAVMDITR